MLGTICQPLPSIFGVISQNSAPYLEVKTMMSCRLSLQPIDQPYQPLVFYLILCGKTMLLGGSSHLVSGLVHPSDFSGLILQTSHVNHWGFFTHLRFVG